MTDDLDRELGQILRAEAAQWTPAKPLGETRRLLPVRIARRRRHQTLAAAGVAAATLLVVALTAAAPGRGRVPNIDLAGPVNSTSTTTRGDGFRAGATDCQDACLSPASTGPGVGNGTVAGSRTTQPRTGRNPATTPAEPTTPLTTGPPSGTTIPPTGTTVPPTSPTSPTTVPVTTTPTTTPPPGQVYVFTEADNGRTVQVNVQDRIILDLNQCGGSEWTEPQSTAADVVRRMSASVDPSAGTASAMFAAVSSGQAQLTAHIRRSPCAPPVAAFVLNVQVVGCGQQTCAPDTSSTRPH